jgi:hypothetical protein
MSSISFKNQKLDSLVGIRELSESVETLNSTDVLVLNNESSFLYSADEITVALNETLQLEAPSTDDEIDFIGRIGTLFGSVGLSEPVETEILPFSFSLPSNVTASSFWNISFGENAQDPSNYRKFNCPIEIIAATSTGITFRILPEDEYLVNETFDSLSVNKPDYGLLLVSIEFQSNSGTKTERSYLMKYTHNPLFSSPILSVPRVFVDKLVNVYTSPGYSSETLFVPTLSSSFVYNFYELEESEYEIYKSRNYKGIPREDVPKFVRLSWNKPPPPQRSPLRIDREAVVDLFDRGALADISFSTPPIAEPPAIERGAILYAGRIVSIPGITSQMASAFAGSPRLSFLADSAFASSSGSFTPEALSNFRTINRGEIAHDLLAVKTSRYIGYVIEKYRISENLTELELVDIVSIPDIDTLEYIDSKIAYGEVYRYAIRTVFRFVNSENLPMFFDSDSLLNQTQTKKYIDGSQTVNLKKTYYYDSESSVAVEETIVENRRPDPPTSVKGFANSKDGKIFLTWSQKNSNRDVVGFNVYRKRESDTNFTKMNSELLGVRENFYPDFEIEKDVKYVYAVESVDVHGNFSKLSIQLILQIKTITNYDFLISEEKQRVFETEGFELNETRQKEETELILVRNKLKINVNPLFKTFDDNNIFVVKVTSLDTGESKQIKLNFTSRSIYHVAPVESEPVNAWLELVGSISRDGEFRRRIAEAID